MRHLWVVAMLLLGGVAHADLSAKQEQAVVAIYQQSGHCFGTGFWAGGYLHTAGHVAAGAPLFIYDGTKYRQITIHSYDANRYDYARCSVPNYTPKAWLKWGTDLCDDQAIRLYGYRLNQFQRWDGVVDRAVYGMPTGAMSNEVVGRAALGTCTSMGGNSGGPVINRRTNEVVGVLTHSTPSDKAVFLRCDMVPKP